ncbi:penicillin acylase family protein [Pseudomonas sp. NPDC078700]|uniref:penicillin acylase family protein n=1 Tax=Pseudomonas sp. NPDC078700 TaxID=3364424 RepID=UPI0037CB76BD
MQSRVFRPSAVFGLTALISAGLVLSGCQSFLSSRYGDSVPPDQGIVSVKGLAKGAVVRRNALGMPLIETSTLHDAIFTLGYVHAGDRLSQMVGMRLLAEGRLSEMVGPGALEVDRLMRAVNLKQSAELLYKGASPRLKKIFEVYARGVNAYMFRFRDKLPMDIAESGYRPAYWKPEDSALIFSLINFGLSVNLQEEIAALIMAQKVGSNNLAWLLPVYPDDGLPFDEADKLKGLKLNGQIAGLNAIDSAIQQVADTRLLSVAASNNWAVSPQKSRSGKSLLANDTHLPLSLPSMWNFVQIRAPKYQVAGVSIAGVPAVVAGFNGKVAWGMTMVMGDNQDIFLEQVKRQNGTLYYLADGKWQPAKQRQETFFIKGQSPIRETIFETRHGPLLNSVLGERKQMLQPLQVSSGYGLALQTAQFETDKSLDAFFDLSRAQSADQASTATREIRAMPLNIVFADAEHIGWQVTGRFPNRRAGVGLMPSPGWDGKYDWDGYAEPMLHPYDQDPQQGWIATANNRTVPPGYGMQLSNSWHYPERAERIAQLLNSGKQDLRSIKAMQYDQTTLFAGKLQGMFEAPGMAAPLKQAIDALPPSDAANARNTLKRLMAFDGNLAANSADAALYGAFLHESARQIFLDELGPDTSAAWKALVETAGTSYSAQADHLLARDDSPFWDDISTPEKETKAMILARSLSAAASFTQSKLGSDPSTWQWGKLHNYNWISDSSKSAPMLSASQRASLSTISSYLDRGPYPAGGDHSTLNVSAYHWGQDFDTWLIPAMRMAVDFGLDEPFYGVNSSGQSGNPASDHYADGIDAWLKGQYMSFPFKSQNIDKVYGSKRLLLTPGK